MDRKLFRVVLYIIPAIMDCVTGIFFFIGPVRATILGHDPLVAGSIVASRSVTCCLFSFIISRYLTSRNAERFMFASGIGLVFVCLSGLGATNLAMIYITSMLCGVCCVTFAVALQVYLKVVDSGEHRSLSRVVGSYTASWCIGMSFGPFITGFLMELGRPRDGVGMSVGWIYTYLAAAALSAAMFLMFLWVRKKTREFMSRHNENPRAKSVRTRDGKSRMPDLARLGWTAAVMGTCANGIIRGVFPAGVTAAGMPEWRSGTIMMLMSMAMGSFAYLVSLGDRWMYSARTLLSFAVMGVLGLNFYVLPEYMGWGIAEQAWQFYVAALVFGSYSGTTYLYSAFHALASPDKDGRNISLNETFIAVGMMAGPLLGGWLAKHYGFFLPFKVSMGLVTALGLLEFFVHRKKTPRTDGEPPR